MHSTKNPAMTPVNPGAQLFEMATFFMKSRAISAAAHLGIADLIQSGIQHCDEIATKLDVNPDALERLLRALVSIGLFAETSPKTYKLTPLSMALVCDAPVTLKHCLSMMGDQSWWLSWGDLEKALVSGKPSINDVLEMDYDSYLAQHPDTLKTFQQCLSTMAKVNNPAIVQGYDFSTYSRIVDVGCGFGDLLIDILKALPKSHGVFFDVPHVVEKINLDKFNLNYRCEKHAGNFFESIVPDGELYLLKQILHDWNDEQTISILKNCALAMKPDSRLLIIETVLDENINPKKSTVYFFDLHMLVTSEGKERRISEFKNLLEHAQLQIIKIYQTESSFSILECQKK